MQQMNNKWTTNTTNEQQIKQQMQTVKQQMQQMKQQIICFWSVTVTWSVYNRPSQIWLIEMTYPIIHSNFVIKM